MTLNPIKSIKNLMTTTQDTKYHKYISFAKQLANDQKMSDEQQSDIASLLHELDISAETLDFDVKAMQARSYIEKLMKDAPGKLKEFAVKKAAAIKVTTDKEALILKLQKELAADKANEARVILDGKFSRYEKCNEIYNVLLQAIPYHDNPLLLPDILKNKHETLRGWHDTFGVPLTIIPYRNDDMTSAQLIGETMAKIVGADADELNPMMMELFKVKELRLHQLELEDAARRKEWGDDRVNMSQR